MEAKKAIEIALNYMKDIYPEAAEFELEEIEYGNRNNEWLITISMPEKLSMSALLANQSNKKYKIISIDNGTGSVNSMKIRKI